jgi:23S rRNA (guanosine2251-2'-O)-methyltransferase
VRRSISRFGGEGPEARERLKCQGASPDPLTVNRLTGIHAVREALEAGRALERIVIARGRHGERIEEIVQLARTRGVPVRFEDRSQVDHVAGTREHQGVVALAAARPASNLEDLLRKAARPDIRKGLLVLLDGVEDPQNLGAVVRTALAAGADGVVIPERRAAGLTESVARASAGALAHLPVARVTNLVRAMEELKEAGYWLVGLDEHAETSYTDADLTVSVGVVLGSEGKGLHELVRRRCDFLVSIPTTGPVRSLNVSVAAGIVLFEAVRQRNKSKPQMNTDPHR